MGKSRNKMYRSFYRWLTKYAFTARYFSILLRKRVWCPILSHVTQRKIIRFAVDPDEGQHIRIALVESSVATAESACR